MNTIPSLPLDNIAPIIGVPKIVKDFIMSDALATRSTDARVLYRIARSIKPSCILEIGTFYGHTTLGLALNCPSAQIFTIDISKEMGIPVPATQRIELLPQSEVGKQFQGKGLNIVQLFADSRDRLVYPSLPLVDLAYIDGNHGYEAILIDSENVIESCRPGAVVTWHDYKDDPSVNTIPALLDLMVLRQYSIYHIQDTWLAFMVVPRRD